MSWKATRNSLVSAGAILVAASPARAGWQTHAPFLFQGKPVDPRCVTALMDPHMNDAGPVHLADCTKPGRIAREGRKFTVVKLRDGNWLRADSYEVLAGDGGRFALLAELAMRGDFNSGHNFLAVVRMQDGALSAETFNFRTVIESLARPDQPRQGDCESGMTNARVEGHVLRWAEATTPYEVLYFGGLKSLDSEKDLDPNEAACAAKRNMEYDLDKSATREASLTFEGPLKDRKGWTERFAHQHCFNAYFNDVLSEGHAELDPAATRAFVDGFARVCLKKVP